jgi:DNA-binding transcriptional MerR regulator
MQLDSSATSSIVPPKLYRIGEVAQYTGFSRQTLHNYTTMGLIEEAKWTAGGHRLYDETVFHRLRRIADLKDDKTIRQIRQILASEQGSG